MKKERISRDRITDLPVELLHHITSPLPFKSIVQTSLLSKRWNRLRLWRSHPHLDFSLLSAHSGAGNFLPEVLSCRPPDSNITTFRLSGCLSAACLQVCVDRVMNQRIEQIELDVDTDCRFELPPSLFNCNTLGVLKLNMGVKLNISRYRGFGLPSPVLFPAVHTLSLTRLCSVWGWSDLFSPSNFSLLRKLCLKDCRGTYDLNINFPGLEILELDGLRLRGLDILALGYWSYK
ncbi:hypothetical protein RHMOL_Rhmol06G0217100 [Rhododendron molle]|uniref:Uncharacterized protein n=1 Tax=Rhododendron molle TaxID=49168 RepID=A0ACC0NGB5_RHOML|nr:hypothetical protein RHMOL_Rhmol06G0217100 [Rhododendron molle]